MSRVQAASTQAVQTEVCMQTLGVLDLASKWVPTLPIRLPLGTGEVCPMAAAAPLPTAVGSLSGVPVSSQPLLSQPQ